MTDVTQGADAPDDASLFSDATTTTLEKFENAEPLPPQPVEPKPVEKVEPPKAVEPPKPEEADAPVPAGRLREVAERARKAERERDELMRQLQAVASQHFFNSRHRPSLMCSKIRPASFATKSSRFWNRSTSACKCRPKPIRSNGPHRPMAAKRWKPQRRRLVKA